jgi:hypothetical protein
MTRATLARVCGVLGILALIVIGFDLVWGGGHPPLSAILLVFAVAPTLTVLLSRALVGVDFPSLPIALFALIEYPLFVFGMMAVLRHARFRSARVARFGVAVLIAYLGAQVAARVALSLDTVNLRLLADANPWVARAAADRLSASGNAAAIPPMQQRLIEQHERQGWVDSSLLDALTALGGAKGWQDLLESGRLGVAGRDARTWRSIVANVREMSSNPYYTNSRGRITTRHLGDQDVARLFDALALELAERSRATADAEASLALLEVMKGRPDLCAKYFADVPNGLREGSSQAVYDLAGALALAKVGPSSDGNYDNQTAAWKHEQARLAGDRDALADEWTAWAKSTTPLCR